MNTRDVHLYLARELSDWEVGYAVANLNRGTFQRQPGAYRVRTVGPTREPVTTMGGLRIVPDLSLAELSAERSAMLILPGSDAYEAGQEQAVLEKAIELERAGVPIAAICGATAGLARIGLLDTRTHTSNAREYLTYQPGYGGAAHYREAKAVCDRGVITASATAPIDFAREIFVALNIYEQPVLDAWYGLYTTGDPRYFHALMQAGAAKR